VTVNFALTSHEFILTPADFSLLEDSFAEAVAGALTAAVDSQHVASASFAAHDVVVLRCDLLPAGQGNDLAIDVRVALPRSKPTQLGSPEPADIDLEPLLLSNSVLEEASRAFSEGTGREMTVKAIQEGSDWVSGLRPRGVPHSCRTAAPDCSAARRVYLRELWLGRQSQRFSSLYAGTGGVEPERRTLKGASCSALQSSCPNSGMKKQGLCSHCLSHLMSRVHKFFLLSPVTLTLLTQHSRGQASRRHGSGVCRGESNARRCVQLHIKRL